LLHYSAGADADNDNEEDYYDTDAKLRLESISVTPDRKSLPQRYSGVIPSASDSYVVQSTPKLGQAATSRSPMVCVLYIVSEYLTYLKCHYTCRHKHVDAPYSLINVDNTFLT